MSQSLVGPLVVLMGAVFFVLTLNEGDLRPYQRVVDSIFHNWIAMTVLTFMLLAVRRSWFGPVPKFFRLLAGILFAFFLMFAAIDVVVWPPLWDFLRLFHVSQRKVQPIAAFGVIGVWGLVCVGLIFRRFLRWLGKRYQHHGVAVGFGPLYFYFKRRRVS